MRKEFSSREELASYLAEQFPHAAKRCSAVSPIPGGAKAANEVLASIEPGPYAFSRNYLDGKHPS